MRCSTHPDVDTNLRCGKCGKLICPKCLIQTPVGARCPQCARVGKLPTYRVDPVYYIRAVAGGIGSAAILGLIWGLVGMFVPFFYLNFIIAGAVGYGIGEAVSLSANRKRGTGLAIVAGAALLLSYVVNIFSFGGFPGSPLGLVMDLGAIALGIGIAVSRLR